MSKLPLIAFLLALASCNCATVRGSSAEESEVETLLASTVQVHVGIEGKLILADKKEVVVENGWTGSGVIYGKTSFLAGPVKSRILSAAHVLDVPKVGDRLKSALGEIRVDRVWVSITTRSRGANPCELTILKVGNHEQDDTAIGVADCDAGPVARIAVRGAPVGALVWVSGHPQGIQTGIVTEGRVSGYYDGYVLLSAPAWPGNSGGPVFYHGEVVGLLVRGGGSYPNISLATTLTAIRERL